MKAAASCVTAGIGDLDWREATARAGGPNNPNRLWPVAVRGFDELLKRKNAQVLPLSAHSHNNTGRNNTDLQISGDGLCNNSICRREVRKSEELLSMGRQQAQGHSVFPDGMTAF